MSTSKFLGKIFSSTSGKSKDDNSNYNLKSKIKKFFIGWYDLEVSQKAGAFSFIGGSLSQFLLPSFLGGGRYFQHGFNYFELEDGNSYIIDYDTEGIHITESSFEVFFYKCQPKYCFQGYHVMNPVELEFEKKYTIEEILRKCKNYIGDNYNLLSNNCQFFVDVFIKELKAKRPKGQYGRGNHSASVFGIPYIILSQLEKNEDDNTNIIGYIPFLGTFIDGFR